MRQTTEGPRAAADTRPATLAAQAAAAAFAAMAEAINELEPELGRLDAVAGDGDHGAGMARGLSAATTAAAQAGPTVADVVDAAALAFADAAGGASGALWGAGLLALGRALRSPRTADGLHEPTLDVATVGAALAAALEATERLGGAGPGDKTLIDALDPFVAAFSTSRGGSIATAWTGAVPAAQEGATATAGLAATRGRAATHGERSRGTPDPGAVSLAAALAAAGEAITGACAPSPPPAEASARK